MGTGFMVGVTGAMILAHAAYSVIQYRGVMKILEEEFTGLPMKVMAELLVGFLLCLWAGICVPGKFLSIQPDSEENRVVSLPSNQDFMMFNHRGRVFPCNTELKLKT